MISAGWRPIWPNASSRRELRQIRCKPKTPSLSLSPFSHFSLSAFQLFSFCLQFSAFQHFSFQFSAFPSHTHIPPHPHTLFPCPQLFSLFPCISCLPWLKFQLSAFSFSAFLFPSHTHTPPHPHTLFPRFQHFSISAFSISLSLPYPHTHTLSFPAFSFSLSLPHPHTHTLTHSLSLSPASSQLQLTERPL
jgi:hypothetical protein